MERDIAHLLIRQHMALIDEGIGPRDPAAADAAILNQAVQSAAGDFDSHDLYDARLITEQHHHAAHPSCVLC